MSVLTRKIAWQRLAQLSESPVCLDPSQPVLDDFTLNNLYIDCSRQQINSEIKQALLAFAQACELPQKIRAFSRGDRVNMTENRAARHMAARAPGSLNQAGQVILTAIQSDPNIQVIVSLGIGGSDLGPRLLTAIFEAVPGAPKIYFLSNLDPQSIDDLIHPETGLLDPRQTAVIINSKTFTTFETCANARAFREWYMGIDADLWQKNSYAVTAAPAQALEFGILKHHILEFSQDIGGRYSIWSAVSLSAILQIGLPSFESFLAGARAVDQHFLEYSDHLEQNIPVWLGLLDIWNINFLNIPSLAVMPYLDRLELLPSYLQQLIMESNGKRVNQQGESLDYQTAPIVWGGIGCPVQHAFMQLLHQSPTCLATADFIISMDHKQRSENLFVSAISQADALWYGQDQGSAHHLCPGRRPSNIFLFRNGFTPYQLGQLLALYEHRVFVQSVLWDINCFDQFGVEVGKQVIRRLLNKQTSGSGSAQRLRDFLAVKS